MEKPKRPLSAYMLWLNSERESIKKENPGIKVTEIAKRGGELWRAMKDKTVSILFIAFPDISLNYLNEGERSAVQSLHFGPFVVHG